MVVLGAACPARAGMILASNFSPPAASSNNDIGIGYYAYPAYTNEAAAQEFAATASGEISTLVVTVDQFVPNDVPLIVTVLKAAGSVPGSVLGSGSFSPNQLSTDGISQPASFDLSAAHIALQAGQDYFVTFTVNQASGSPRYRAELLGGSNPSGFGFKPLYSRNGGTTWSAESAPNEIGLIVNGNAGIGSAATVPEPSSLAIAMTLTGGACLFGLLRRQGLSLFQ